MSRIGVVADDVNTATSWALLNEVPLAQVVAFTPGTIRSGAIRGLTFDHLVEITDYRHWSAEDRVELQQLVKVMKA